MTHDQAKAEARRLRALGKEARIVGHEAVRWVRETPYRYAYYTVEVVS